MTALPWTGAIVAAVAALYGLDRFLLWAEREHWIYYRKRKPNPRSVAMSALELQGILEPDRKYMIEVQREHVHEEQGEGEPPVAGSSERPENDQGGHGGPPLRPYPGEPEPSAAEPEAEPGS